MPTAVPVAISVQSPRYPLGSNHTVLVNRASNLRLYGSASGLAYMPSYTYNWSTSNTSTLSGPCFVIAGPYLSLPSSCLRDGAAYLFRLLVSHPDGVSGDSTVRRKLHNRSLGDRT
jgi:hypothetical protein